MKAFVKTFLRRHNATIINIFLVVALGHYTIKKVYEAWVAEQFNFVEVAFAAHNIVWLAILLVRRQHLSMDRNVFHQMIALAAFFSGIVFFEHPSESSTLTGTSQGIVAAAWVLSTVTLLNLGRSFGILIAVRQVKTGGLYSVIRHPMYFTDILLRVGYLAGNLYWPNAIIFIASSGCYVYRAILEERFLSQLPDYRAYKKKVRYRFVPGVF